MTLVSETHIASKFSALKGKLRKMAPIHQTTFQALVEHLKRVAANSAENKMDAKVSSIGLCSKIFSLQCCRIYRLSSVSSWLITLAASSYLPVDTVMFGQDQLPSDGNILAMHLEKVG